MNLGACGAAEAAKTAIKIHANEVAKNAAAGVAAKAASANAAKAAKPGKKGGSGFLGIVIGAGVSGSLGFALLLWCVCRPSSGDAGEVARAGGGGYCATFWCCTCCCGAPCPVAHAAGLEVGGECAAAVMAEHVAGKATKIAWEEK